MISKGCKSIFPIKHQEIWDRYKLHIQAFWTPEEVSLQDDLRDLQTLNDYIKNKRVGRLEFLSDDEKKVVWTISEILTEELNDLGKTTHFRPGNVSF